MLARVCLLQVCAFAIIHAAVVDDTSANSTSHASHARYRVKLEPQVQHLNLIQPLGNKKASHLKIMVHQDIKEEEITRSYEHGTVHIAETEVATKNKQHKAKSGKKHTEGDTIVNTRVKSSSSTSTHQNKIQGFKNSPLIFVCTIIGAIGAIVGLAVLAARRSKKAHMDDTEVLDLEIATAPRANVIHDVLGSDSDVSESSDESDDDEVESEEEGTFSNSVDRVLL